MLRARKRTLGPFALIALGIGAVIGSGLFVRTASAIAERAGLPVTIAYIISGAGCGRSREILFGHSRDAAGTITGVLHDEH